ncbi:HTH lysR-type domain-containing protein, partial [Dysosmobacter welbionis]
AQPQADGEGSCAPAEIAAGEEITDLDLHVLRHGHP